MLDLPGWPLLSPLKVQLQKCDKCSKEFCSTINYRRHMRLHRRNLNINKVGSYYVSLVSWLKQQDMNWLLKDLYF